MATHATLTQHWLETWNCCRSRPLTKIYPPVSGVLQPAKTPAASGAGRAISTRIAARRINPSPMDISASLFFFYFSLIRLLCALPSPNVSPHRSIPVCTRLVPVLLESLFAFNSSTSFGISKKSFSFHQFDDSSISTNLTQVLLDFLLFFKYN